MKRIIVVAALAVAAALLGVQPAQAHTSTEIRSAAQSWVDRGAPYSQLTSDSQALVTASTWSAWVRCGHNQPTDLTATVRGHGRDLAVVRFTNSHGTFIEWTAFYRSGRWVFQLPGKDVDYLQSHTPGQVASCR